VAAFAESDGLTPIKIRKEQPGYLINTVLLPLFKAPLSRVEGGVSSHQDVDRTWLICNGGTRLSHSIKSLDSTGRTNELIPREFFEKSQQNCADGIGNLSGRICSNRRMNTCKRHRFPPDIIFLVIRQAKENVDHDDLLWACSQ